MSIAGGLNEKTINLLRCFNHSSNLIGGVPLIALFKLLHERCLFFLKF
jgi:hypothetical protein